MRGSIFNAKSLTRIGAWNVRTLFQCGKLAQLLNEFDRYRMGILGISEMRWTNTGRMASDGKSIIYSGHDTEHGRGVGIVMSKKAASALVGWKPVSDRIITARFQTTHAKVTIIQAYAPIEDAEADSKDEFYDQLQQVLNETARHDIILLIGDFNAKIGKERQGLEHVIGPHGSAAETNDNGDRLTSLCAANGLSIGNTYFDHKKIHKKTWRSPDGETLNEIDYTCISKRWRSSLVDVRTCRGADIGSDHYLLLAKCRIRLKRQQTQQQRPRPFAVDRLKDRTVAERFALELRNRFEVLAEETDTDIERQWTKITQAITGSAENTIGRKRGAYKERWIRNRTWDLIDKRRSARQNRDQARTEEERETTTERYRQLDRKVKRSCRRDKREWLDQKGQEAQAAADRNDTKMLYRIVRDLTGAKSGQGAPVKDKNGKPLLTKEEQDARWVEHFKETLNQPPPGTTFTFDPTDPANNLDVRTDPITTAETAAAIRLLKNGKAPGLDMVSAEMLKHGGRRIVEEMTNLLNLCWTTAQVPEDWRKGVIVKLPKKGNLADCNNWRGITLLSVPGKVFSIVLLKRLQTAVDQKLREEQAGFRSGRSCTEQIFILRTIIEQSLEYQQRLSINFVDFTKAFDSVHRDSLWKIVRSYGIPERFVEIFRNLYLGSSCCIRTEDGNTDFFAIETGVRQGCILSPFLFLISIDFVMRTAMDQEGFGIQWRAPTRLTDLDFADDIALLADIKKNMQKMTERLEQEAAKVGLRISGNKTKVMRIGHAATNIRVTVGQQQLEEVDQFTYLGSVLTNDGNADHDAACRIAKAGAVFQRLLPIWSTQKIDMATKIRLLNSIVIPTAIYASETWKTSVKIARRLNVAQQRWLRRILRISYRDHITNEEIHRRTATRPLNDIVTERRMRFAGHILRQQQHRLAKAAITWTPPRGRRKQGRPRTTWRRTFIDDLKALDISWDEAEVAAADRSRWRDLAAQCAVRRRRT